MSLELGCRGRLLQTEDGVCAVAVLDAWESRIATMTAELNQAKDGIARRENQLRKADESHTEMRAEVARLRGELHQTRMLAGDRYEQYQSEIARLREELTCIRAEVTRLREKYDLDISDKELAHQAEVAQLREELEKARRDSCASCVSALAAERAAREKAEREWDAERLVAKGHHANFAAIMKERDFAEHALVEARIERDAALARVKELKADRREYVVKLDVLREQIHEQALAGREDGKLIAELKEDSRRSDSLRVAEVSAARAAQQAAESALASARKYLTAIADEIAGIAPKSAAALRAWLSSAPSPLPAPCPTCILDVPLSKAADESVIAEAMARGIIPECPGCAEARRRGGAGVDNRGRARMLR